MTHSKPKLWPLPLRSRELLYWQIISARPHPTAGTRTSPALTFAPGVSLRLSVADGGHRGITYCGFLELSLSRVMRDLAAQGGLLLDVGANVGYFTCMWTSARPDNRVIAFEPAPNTFAMLSANVQDNAFTDRVELHSVAVSDTARAAARFVDSPDGQSGLSHLDLVNGSPTEDHVLVSTTTLDSLFAQNRSAEHVRVLKIDTEGADALVLAGAQDLLGAGRIANVLFEYDKAHNERFEGRIADPHGFLSGLGYSVRRLSRYVWHAQL